MKTLIIYESLHGSSEKCATRLKELIGGEIQLARLSENDKISLNPFENVIIGGSIHMGVIQSRVQNFVMKHQNLLLEKQLGLFLCCMEEGETARQQFAKAYPAGLRDHAVASGLFGGEFNFKKMNFFERKITKKITGVKNSVSKIDDNEIVKFAGKFKTT